jgi:hypothetical protein
MLRKSCAMGLVGALALACANAASAQVPRVNTVQKGSLLLFSKIEIKWDESGNALLQDTIVDISNDYPANVAIQAYFINGDVELEKVCEDELCTNIVQTYEPGWNTADCLFELTANQPHYWSAAKGSDKCQPFTVLDSQGPGRLDPETNRTSRILRGYVLFYAVKYDRNAGSTGEWTEIRWNHLKGDAVIVNYQNGTAWEYNAWAFQARSVGHGEPMPPAGVLRLDGVEYDSPYASLVLDFYASGSTALTGGQQQVMVDTDLTLHAVSVDLKQDNCGPILTKVEAQIWNEFETKFSGTRRCICCWDQTMLSNWVRSISVPNHFTRAALRTDKGQARLDGVESTECDYVSLCGPTAAQKRFQCGRLEKDEFGNYKNSHDQSEATALLGLTTKFLVFSPSNKKAATGMSLVGMGEYPATIYTDVMVGPDEINTDSTSRAQSARSSSTKGTDGGRDASRIVDVIPSE